MSCLLRGSCVGESASAKSAWLYFYFFFDINVIDSLNEFKNKSDVIVSNRLDAKLSDVSNKVFTRDIFGNN